MRAATDTAGKAHGINIARSIQGTPASSDGFHYALNAPAATQGPQVTLLDEVTVTADRLPLGQVSFSSELLAIIDASDPLDLAGGLPMDVSQQSLRDHPFAATLPLAIFGIAGAADVIVGAAAAEGTGTIWGAITATQDVYEGTVIPRSFTLATDGVLMCG